MSFELSDTHQHPELPQTELALLLIEGTEMVLERIARFRQAVERMVVSTDGPRHAMKELERLLRELLQDLQSALSEIAAFKPSN